MNSFNKTLDQLKDSSNKIKSNLHILDEIIPIEEQKKYLQYSNSIHSGKIKLKLDKKYLINKLLDPDLKLEDRRLFLIILAGIVGVDVYRAIEAYHKNPLESELIYWSAMALAENRVLLNTDLCEEKQYFVSTGLGACKGMLRFFGVIASSDLETFTSFQKECLIKELEFAFNKSNIVLEELVDKNNYLKITILSCMYLDLRSIISKTIDEINLLGSFVSEKFILTNLKEVDDTEIYEMLETA